MFAYDIDLVAGSPFGSTAEGKRIVEVLRQLNAKGRIVYGGNLDGSRGDWDGTTIRVDQRFSGKVVGSTVEMVHEATHALWRKAPSEMKDATARWQATVDDEVRAQENQLTVYRYLTVEKSLPRDTELEWRLEQQAAGTLRKMVEMQFLDSKPK
jgi:hypothetical protein